MGFCFFSHCVLLSLCPHIKDNTVGFDPRFAQFHLNCQQEVHRELSGLKSGGDNMLEIRVGARNLHMY